jgi:glycosyltransferase involved in cell wall biosynthesis
MLDSLVSTTHGYEIEIIALIDDDEESAEIALKHGCVVDYSTERRGVLYLWNKGLAMSSGDMIHPAMDDLVYHESWLRLGLESHTEKLGRSGVIGFNDLAYDGNKQVATQFMFDRQYCKDYMGGVIAPPVYNYLWIDVEINERAKLAGKFYWDERAIVEHRHSAHGKREYDIHDKHKNDNNWAEIDGKIYEERKVAGFPVTWQPII